MNMKKERVIENLRQALHILLKEDPFVLLIGEDVEDPYGGAFKASKGLSTEMPGRIINTPISEESFVNMASGMAIMGLKPIVDMMFSDFTALAFDALLNFASKSVTMYGKHLDLSMIIRCANGGYRGYGATHSQSMQKYFMGIPNLSVYEMTPFHDNRVVFKRMLEEKNPCMYFEEKVMYPQFMHQDGKVNEIWAYTLCGHNANWAVVAMEDSDNADAIIICPGGLAHKCISAAEKLLLEEEIEVKICVPSKLYPCEIEEIIEVIGDTKRILVVEEGTPGNSWGDGITNKLYKLIWDSLDRPIELLTSDDSIIPASFSYEEQVLIQEDDIYTKVIELVN